MKNRDERRQKERSAREAFLREKSRRRARHLRRFRRRPAQPARRQPWEKYANRGARPRVIDQKTHGRGIKAVRALFGMD